jgi:hypothetical protein
MALSIFIMKCDIDVIKYVYANVDLSKGNNNVLRYFRNNREATYFT